MVSVARLLRTATTRLEEAGVASPAGDARLLLAHLLAIPAGRLFAVREVADDVAEGFGSLVERRAGRVPLQHLTGVAYFRHVEVEVGPGVFVPRPETEMMTGWAVERLQALTADGRRPLVVELCAGSGAISKAIITEVPGVRIQAVEIAEAAVAWAQRNLAGLDVEVHAMDMAAVPHAWDQTADLVIANPPYIPLDAYDSVVPEAREHDPPVALFSGPDGLEALRQVADVAGRLLVDGGLVCAEHAEVQAHSAPEVFVRHGSFRQVRDNLDLTGRPRFVTATRGARVSATRRSGGLAGWPGE
jgi:release factor glutamine methyltransferase